jgi:tetratricopeptide (TPR) repeat protein
VLADANRRLSGLDVWQVGSGRPADDLLLAARALSGRALDATGAAVPLEPAAMREVLEALARRHPTDFTLDRVDLARWHRDEARACADSKDWSAAAYHWGRAFLANPEDVAALRGRAAAYEKLDLTENAVADYELALKVKAEPATWVKRAELLRKLGRYEDEAADYTRALAAEPGRVDVRLRRGSAHVRLGRWKEALADLDVVLKARPKDAFARSLRAEALAGAGQLKEAIAAYTEALVGRPGDESLLQGRSKAYFALGRPKEGLADFLEAIHWVVRARRARPTREQCLAALPEVERRLREGEAKKGPKGLREGIALGDLREQRAFLLRHLGRRDEAAAAYLEVIEKEKNNRYGSHSDGRAWLLWLAARARLPGNEAAADFLRRVPGGVGADGAAPGGLMLPLSRLYYPNRIACLLVAGGDREAYRRFCKWVLANKWRLPGAMREGDRLAFREWEWTGAYCCVLGPDAVEDYGPLLKKLAEFDRRTRPSLKTPAWSANERSLEGALLFRAGRLAEAKKALHEARRWHPEGGDGFLFVFLAMTHARLKEPAEARQWLERAGAHMDWRRSRWHDMPEVFPDLMDMGPWWDWMELYLLRREAEALLAR